MGFSPISPTPPPGIGGRRKQGHAEAQHQLSLLHLDGYRAQRRRASRDGTVPRPSATARPPTTIEQLLFPNGFDVPRDPAEALRWSRAAAEQGIADAQANTGLIYARRDRLRARLSGSSALVLARRRAGQRRRRARPRHSLRQWSRGGEGSPGRRGWYEKAAEKGNAAAQVALGLMYLSGQGVDRDTDKAAEWFGKAAEQGQRARAVQSGAARSGRRRAGRATSAPPKPCCARPRGKSSSRR